MQYLVVTQRMRSLLGRTRRDPVLQPGVMSLRVRTHILLSVFNLWLLMFAIMPPRHGSGSNSGFRMRGPELSTWIALPPIRYWKLPFAPLGMRIYIVYCMLPSTRVAPRLNYCLSRLVTRFGGSCVMGSLESFFDQ